jgi:hypothetical protein
MRRKTRLQVEELDVDTASVSALAALAGSGIGGVISFGTAWSTQHAPGQRYRLVDQEDKYRVRAANLARRACMVSIADAPARS